MAVGGNGTLRGGLGGPAGYGGLSRFGDEDEYDNDMYDSDEGSLIIGSKEGRLLLKAETERLVHMEDELHKRVVGQDDAIMAISRAIRRSRAGLKNPQRPIGSFIFSGPTGVGKTEITRRLAQLIDAPFIKVEATKYTEVGYYGRDVESMIRDLVEAAINLVRTRKRDEVQEEAETKTEQRLVELLKRARDTLSRFKPKTTLVMSEMPLMAGEPALHEFPSWRSFWIFQQSVRSELRYVRTAASETFLQTVLETCRERVGNLKAGSHFWRAQLGHDWRLTGPEEAEIEIPCAYSASRMKPLSGRASDGRANPRGIPSLYVATTKETAMSEVRPWVGSYVSVGQLRMLQDLKVVDCTRGHQKTPFYLEEPDADHRN